MRVAVHLAVVVVSRFVPVFCELAGEPLKGLAKRALRKTAHVSEKAAQQRTVQFMNRCASCVTGSAVCGANRLS